jgi:hypothetical protein
MAAKGELSPGRAVRLLLLYGVSDLQGREGDAGRVHTVQGGHRGIVLFSKDDITKTCCKKKFSVAKIWRENSQIFFDNLRNIKLSWDSIYIFFEIFHSLQLALSGATGRSGGNQC